MKMYKIETLGKSFIFIPNDMDEKMPIPKEEESDCVLIGYSMNCDFSIKLKNPDVFMPDLYRALMTYIYRVNGYPSGEYEIDFLNKKRKIILPSYKKKIGGNVGKCKLTFSNECKKLSEYGYEICRADTENGVYLSLICDNIDNFDTKKLLSRIYSSKYSMNHINALLILSKKEKEAEFLILVLPNRHFSLSSTAFAAVFCTLSEFGITDTDRVFSGKYAAVCEKDDNGVYVFDTSPFVYKLI